MNPLHLGETMSLWHDTEALPQFDPLKNDMYADVCIVGGGIAGLTTAYLLAREGKSVCLLEAFELGSGQTGKTTAHFANALDDRFFELEKYHGERGVRLAIDSHTAAIKLVEEIVQNELIDCDTERLSGYLFKGHNDSGEIIHNEYEACQRMGYRSAELVATSPIASLGKCLHFPRQLQLHPVKYLRGLAEAVLRMEGKIFTHTQVVKIEDGGVATVKTAEGFEVKCGSVVVATNTPINDRFAIHTKQAPYRTYVLGFKVKKGSIPKGLYWDTEDPYHYVRIHPGPDAGASVAPVEAYDILIVGGGDHKTGQSENPEASWQKLLAWTKAKFPVAQEVVYQWSGQVLEPVDGLAYLGRNPGDTDNIYIITGDSGNGMTHTTVGAMLITDLIVGRENQWEDLYSPSRITMRASGEFIKENTNVAAQYLDWLTQDSISHIAELEPGEGRVFRKGVKLIAAYKDENGRLETVSAVCPHLAGVVSWNSAEKSWDCPCHGSRFDCHGKVIEGPAFSDLEKVDQLFDTCVLPDQPAGKQSGRFVRP